MNERFFVSDLHFGHRKAAFGRGFNSVADHDQGVYESLASLPRRSKLWILGDVAFNKKGLEWVRALPPRVKVLVRGNHDHFSTQAYLDVFDEVLGAASYRGFWLTHIPVHPQELYRDLEGSANIHGHLHKGAKTAWPIRSPGGEIDRRYINTNWDFWRRALSFEEIVDLHTGHGEWPTFGEET